MEMRGSSVEEGHERELEGVFHRFQRKVDSTSGEMKYDAQGDNHKEDDLECVRSSLKWIVEVSFLNVKSAIEVQSRE